MQFVDIWPLQLTQRTWQASQCDCIFRTHKLTYMRTENNTKVAMSFKMLRSNPHK